MNQEIYLCYFQLPSQAITLFPLQTEGQENSMSNSLLREKDCCRTSDLAVLRNGLFCLGTAHFIQPFFLREVSETASRSYIVCRLHLEQQLKCFNCALKLDLRPIDSGNFDRLCACSTCNFTSI